VHAEASNLCNRFGVFLTFASIRDDAGHQAGAGAGSVHGDRVGAERHRSDVPAYDPINDKAVPLKAKAGPGGEVALMLTAVDYPYLLTVEEAGSAAR